MAVNKVPQGAVMSIKVQAGLTSTGGPGYKTLRFSNVKPGTTDADFFEVANAIAGLQSYPLALIERIDTAALANA
ncbi:DUF1659 domain-containing protein [Pelosinus sp. sgz500959]|uniref:DUF1659 domain-containing protein n=1 Tax=Pelosinus sp. sgz500959 TaxID=3242472 RepID=UPI0036728753